MIPAATRSAPATSLRWARFVTIGALGFLLQITILRLLTAQAHWSWMAATLVSVELAVLHNFFWHTIWTWRDRPGGLVVRLARFQLTNGLASVAGNAALMALFAGALSWPPIPANSCAVAVMAVANFVMADRWVFRQSVGRSFAIVLCVACVGAPVRVAAQTAGTLSAWQRVVATTEARLEQSRTASRPVSRDAIAAGGESIRVPSGTISDWTGSVFIPGITLDRLLHRLQHPGTPPPQEEVVSSRVLARGDDSLRVSIRLVRRAIVTVTYDTEHEMHFHRWTPRLATARSVATRIEEVGGGDHGFLWRLHSYWRYEEVDGGVRVDLESLTLSRDVPSIIRPIAAPLVARVARESMVGTLEALRRFFAPERTMNREGVAQTR